VVNIKQSSTIMPRTSVISFNIPMPSKYYIVLLLFDWKMLHFVVCFMKFHWVLCEILRFCKSMLNSKQLKIANMQIYSWHHFRWMTYWAIQILEELVFYLIFYSNWISSRIHPLNLFTESHFSLWPIHYAKPVVTSWKWELMRSISQHCS
jgi:hypothetical protein